MTEIQKAVYVKRLLEWARMVANKENRLRMESWRCGGACCAAGWAARCPEFNKAGLLARHDGSPVFKNSPGGIPAIQKFFGITEATAFRICLPEEYPIRWLRGKGLRDEVVRRIREAAKKVGHSN